MKTLLRHILVNLVAIYVTSLVVTGLSWSGNLTTLLLAALGLGIVNLVVRPVVKVITLPINFITLGLFSLVINVLMLYLVTQFIPGFSVSAFSFSGYNLYGFIIPATHFSELGALLVASLGISLITTIMGWFVSD